MSRSRTYPVASDDAFARMLPMPLPDIFDRRFGPIPPIVGVEQDGVWGTVGQVRTIRTGDGGEMREELTSLDAPHVFTYLLTPQGGPMAPLVDHVDGEWRFEPVGTGCRITWTWTVHPRSAAGGVALPVFRRFWLGYARRALDRLEERLLAG
jgi:hypothetical protein